MTEEEVYRHLLGAIDQAGGQRPFARQLGVTPSYINDVVNKRRLMSDRILGAIGIKRVVTFTYTYQEDQPSTVQDSSEKP